MKITFITRCYKPTNIQRIKDNLHNVFSNQDKIQYEQYLLVDLSYNQPQQNFKVFEDEHTKVHFTYQKKDYYNNSGIDQLVQSLEGDQNNFVYVFDDDNLITEDFLKVFDDYNGQDVLVVCSKKFNITSPHSIAGVIGNVDTSSYLVKLRVRKETPAYIQGNKSYATDGIFFKNLLIKNYSFKYTKLMAVQYAALKRPLNVLRKDL